MCILKNKIFQNVVFPVCAKEMFYFRYSLKAYGLGSTKYTFCQKCFNDIQGDTVSLGDDPTQAQT